MMTATIGAATSGSRPELITATYRRLRRMGFDDPEAANLTALKNGFGIGRQPWTARELTHLLFIRESHGVSRRWPGADHPVERTDEIRVPAVPPRNCDDGDPSDGRVTLLTLLRSTAGPSATLDTLSPSTRPRLEAADHADGEGG